MNPPSPLPANAGPRRRAVIELGANGTADSLALLCTAALTDRSRAVRAAAREAVARLCERHRLDLAVEVLERRVPASALIEAFASSHPETRDWSLAALHPQRVAGLIAEGVAATALIEWSQGRAATTRVGWWAALVLLERGDRRALIPLAHSLRVGSERVRRWLLGVVGELGYLRIVRFLCDALIDRAMSTRVRRDAAQSLGGLGHPAALPTLRVRAKFWVLDNGEVKSACRAAIKRIESRGVAALPSAASSSLTTDTLPRPASKEIETATLPRATEATPHSDRNLPPSSLVPASGAASGLDDRTGKCRALPRRQCARSRTR